VLRAIKSAPAGEWAKWCAFALILLTPGSFVIVPVVWLARQWAARGMARARISR
jgi:hypothetical protein